MAGTALRVAITDYGLGNLFSVQQACAHAGMEATITSQAEDVSSADAVILPGVGAFGDAMNALERLGLIPVLKDAATSGKPMLGICLGAQLLQTESEEFGLHEGLGLIPGRVVSLGEPRENGTRLKVPHVGWNRIYRGSAVDGRDPWRGTLLDDQREGEFMYFVHSFVLGPEDDAVVLSVSRYGDLNFCSAIAWGGVTALQFHPERSGPQGLRIYQGFADQIRAWKQRMEDE